MVLFVCDSASVCVPIYVCLSLAVFYRVTDWSCRREQQ